MSDTTNTHGDAPQGGVDPAAIKRGHEVDSYDTKSVLSVPVLVILFFGLAFGTVTLVFNYVSKSITDPMANPQAVEQNSASWNERLARIDRSSGGPSDQPRLEPLRERKGDVRGFTQIETETGNSPELHPEDIRANKNNTPELFTTGSIAGDKAASHLTIDEAMKLALEKNLFPVQKTGVQPPQSAHLPTESNAGRGAAESIAVPPKLPEAAPKPPEAGGGKK